MLCWSTRQTCSNQHGNSCLSKLIFTTCICVNRVRIVLMLVYIGCSICRGFLSSAEGACEVFCCVCTENGPHGRSLTQHKTARAKKARESYSVKCIWVCVCSVKAQRQQSSKNECMHCGGFWVKGFEFERECLERNGRVYERLLCFLRGVWRRQLV